MVRPSLALSFLLADLRSIAGLRCAAQPGRIVHAARAWHPCHIRGSPACYGVRGAGGDGAVFAEGVREAGCDKCCPGAVLHVEADGADAPQ